jgi:hypothetical protein
MKCQSPQWIMALEIVNTGAPSYAVDASNIFARCAKTTEERIQAAKLREDAEKIELRSVFLLRLANAREYRRVGLDSDAAVEYDKAYNALPLQYEKFVDHNAAENGRSALRSSRFREAADLFELAFAKIAVP